MPREEERTKLVRAGKLSFTKLHNTLISSCLVRLLDGRARTGLKIHKLFYGHSVI